MSKIEGEKFLEKYGDLLAELSKMPQDSKTEGRRKAFLKSKVDYQCFSEEVLSAAKPNSYEKMGKDLQKMEKDLQKINRKLVDERYAIDSVAFMEALEITIRRYTGVSGNGKEYTFLQAVSQNYKSEKGKMNIDSEFQNIDSRTLARLRRIVEEISKQYTAQELKAMGKREFVLKVKQVCSNAGISYVSMDKYYHQMAELAFGLSVLRLDSLVSEEDNDKTQVDFLKDDKAEVQHKHIIDREQLKKVVEDIMIYFQNKEMPKNKIAKEWMQMFMSHYLIRALKCELIQKEGKTRYFVTGTGNYDIYETFSEKEMAEAVYEILIDKGYTDYLYIENADSWKEMFIKHLMEDIHYMDDSLIAKFRGCSESNVTKKQAQFREVLRALPH